MRRIWWAERERQRFFTYTGCRQHPKRPRVVVGSFKRRMSLSPWILLSQVYVPRSMPKQSRRVRSLQIAA